VVTQQYQAGPGGHGQNPDQPQAPYGYPPAATGYSPSPTQPLGYATPIHVPIDVGEIARRQRAVMYCMLFYILLVLGNFFVTMPKNRQAGDGSEFIALMLSVCALLAMITSAVFVFRLAMVVHNRGTGIVMGILTLVPLLGLIILLMVNGKATALLRRHGIRVGLMGADPRQIPPAGQYPQQVFYQPPAGGAQQYPPQR
jgi:hypothetical protein